MVPGRCTAAGPTDCCSPLPVCTYCSAQAYQTEPTTAAPPAPAQGVRREVEEPSPLLEVAEDVVTAAGSAAAGNGAAAQPAAAAEPAAPPPLDPADLELLAGLGAPLVKITTHYHVNFGDFLKVVGSGEELGEWAAPGAPRMTWSEGDLWTLVMPLPPGEYEFKVVVQQRGGGLLWEGGGNRALLVPEDVSPDELVLAECAYGFADLMPPAGLVAADAASVALLREQAAEAAVVAAAAAEEEAERQSVVQAAAAVARALASMGV